MTISAQKLQELESQLSGLEQVKPKNQKERKKLEQEKETLTRTVASLKAYLALEVGGEVTDGTKFGVIISKTLSLEGMPLAWVSWSGAVEVPEQPERLTVISPQETVRTPNSTVWLALEEIRRDGGTQPRVKMNLSHIKRLEEQIEEGQQLEPVVVFHDGENYWLADGFHRWQAHSNQEEGVIACTVETGSRRDAILYSVGANADHKPALPRSSEDKRRAVLTLLQDPEWGQWSDREIGRQCQVSDRTVNRLRQSICDNVADTKLNKERKFQRGGKTYNIDTTNIGSKKAVQLSVNSYQLPVNNDSLVTDNWSLNTDSLEVSQSSPVPPQKVEVNTNDILIAFISNLDYMSEAQVTAAVKAIAHLNPNLIRQVLDSPEEF